MNTIVKIMNTIVIIMIIALVLKAMIIGSDFNFIKWAKYGKKYMKQYNEWYKMKP
jgi:hypothetical protein